MLKNTILIKSLKIKKGFLFYLISCLSLITTSNKADALTLVNPNEWTRFTFSPVGRPPDDTYRFVSADKNKIYSLKVTDAGTIGDELLISVNGNDIGRTSSVFTGGSCGFNPDSCFGTASSGTFSLPLGNERHDITITSLENATTRLGGAGFLKVEPLEGTILANYEFSQGSGGKGIVTKPLSYAILPSSEIIPSTPGIFSNGNYVTGVPIGDIDPNLPISMLSSLSQLGNWESAESILQNTKSSFAPEKISGNTAVEAQFSPKGKNIGSVFLGSLAKAMGYSHFNWLQVISKQVSTIDIYTGKGNRKETLVVDDGVIKAPTGKYFDVLFLGSNICDNSGGNCSFTAGDTKDFYLDIPGFGNPDPDYFKQTFPTSVNFYDRPFKPIIPFGEYTEFTTMVVGVKENDPTYENYELIDGSSFTWKSNLTCKTKKCLEETGGISGFGKSYPLDLDALGLTEEDFTGGVEILDPQIFLNELPQDILKFLNEEGAKLPDGLIDDDDSSGEIRTTPEPNTTVGLVTLLSFGRFFKRRLARKQ